MTTADVNDRNGALLMFLLNDDRPANVRNVLVDGGYTSARLEGLVFQILGATVDVVKHNELHQFVVVQKRRASSVPLPD